MNIWAIQETVLSRPILAKSKALVSRTFTQFGQSDYQESLSSTIQWRAVP